MHLVNQVHLVAAAGRRELDVVHQLAGLVDLRSRRRIHLDQVDEPPLVEFGARAALAARPGGDAGFTVDALGEEARERRLADPAGPGEEEGVVEPIRIQRIDERTHDVGLSHELLEVARPPLAGKHLIAHVGLRSIAGRGGGSARVSTARVRRTTTGRRKRSIRPHSSARRVSMRRDRARGSVGCTSAPRVPNDGRIPPSAGMSPDSRRRCSIPASAVGGSVRRAGAGESPRT